MQGASTNQLKPYGPSASALKESARKAASERAVDFARAEYDRLRQEYYADMNNGAIRDAYNAASRRYHEARSRAGN